MPHSRAWRVIANAGHLHHRGSGPGRRVRPVHGGPRRGRAAIAASRETYLAVGDDTDVAGNTLLRTVNRTRLPQPAGPKPEYLLRHDGACGCWALDSRDLDDSLAPWIDARELTCADDLDAAQAWAAREIAAVWAHTNWSSSAPASSCTAPQPPRQRHRRG